MRFLVLNCGSSSLKFAVYHARPHDAAPTRTASGTYQGIGDATSFAVEDEGRPSAAREVDVADHRAAAAHLVRWWYARDEHDMGIDATAHRVVHGGDLFAPTVVDDSTLEAISAASALAPLHNQPAIETIEVVRELVDAPAVAVFDTAFHRTLPARAAQYAMPRELVHRLGIRRHGFHGLAHRSMADRWADQTGRRLDDARLITCQLGSGVSVTAIDRARSIDTTMGFTPLEGLMMATRSGDVDPSIPRYLTRHGGMDLEEVDELLTRRSGLLGVSGRSGHVGRLLEAEADGDRDAGLALDMFCYRVRKQIGAYLAALDGADALVFGGGIGERFPEIRARVCDDMAWCGLEVDAARNEERGSSDGEISGSSTSIAVWVLAPDEAAVMADDVAALLRRDADVDRDPPSSIPSMRSRPADP